MYYYCNMFIISFNVGEGNFMTIIDMFVGGGLCILGCFGLPLGKMLFGVHTS